MQSSIIGKIEKAKRYAQEKERITFSDLSVNFRGETADSSVNSNNGKWRCTCRVFSQWGLCRHTMALEQILKDMLPEEALKSPINNP